MEKKKKTLSGLKLNQLSQNELDRRAMKVLKGGCGGCHGDCSNGGGGTSMGSSWVNSYYGGY